MTEDALSATPSVRTKCEGHLGRIILDRPAKLNALDADTAAGISRVLAAWANEGGVRQILLESSSPRAFCAGGDLKTIREVLLNAGPDEGFARMDRAYDTMLQLARYTKPVVSFLDGIVMGGGVGIGCHVGYRVVTERSVLAMPETAIGLVTDAGGSWLLSRAAGHEGLRLALTGQRMSGQDAVRLGLADRLVPAESLESLRDSLALEDVEEVFANLPTGPATLVGADAEPGYALESCYAAPDLPSAMERLRASPLESAHQDMDELSRACPFSLYAAWHAWHRARKARSLEEAFDIERRLVRCVLGRADIVEGVRARLVDRDNAPVWQPASLQAMTPAELQEIQAA
ncbi:enoyl-CoA hydratase/isomerase family protein [Acetobacter sp. TBRC 12305]|uniref:3-hydroxyisobutyryl-CoA hydrolase n=1 Tax=Acetobacter garciniae TaxID=2817435 RepID=A0A939KN37_9PROT|nr:enoyl-CoA hydratase/isomerase family protein [Acetobacter garciniae]MBO1325240.1 enoyl-CoA hydratase/isomerase family protein [Acetobacter garciniae]MBX0344788.1 enoyl-CoA hydratase/isomerase family protein [Acetobacter garciniae]